MFIPNSKTGVERRNRKSFGIEKTLAGPGSIPNLAADLVEGRQIQQRLRFHSPVTLVIC